MILIRRGAEFRRRLGLLRCCGRMLLPTTMGSATRTASALTLFGRRTGLVFCWARHRRAGLACLAGLCRVSVRAAMAALTLRAPGGFSLPALCFGRPVYLRRFAAVGVTHVSFPPRRATPIGMLQALI